MHAIPLQEKCEYLCVTPYPFLSPRAVPMMYKEWRRIEQGAIYIYAKIGLRRIRNYVWFSHVEHCKFSRLVEQENCLENDLKKKLNVSLWYNMVCDIGQATPPYFFLSFVSWKKRLGSKIQKNSSSGLGVCFWFLILKKSHNNGEKSKTKATKS